MLAPSHAVRYISLVWQVEYSPGALKVLARMPRNVTATIRGKIDKLASNPRAPHPQVKPLVGRPGILRLRVGDWRVIYRLDDGRLIVLVLEVAPGGGAYG